ncbi:helix-turn-helix transcriptional regulator [Bailinhaonella thermotolerans]|uniref:XRE family transcriptional regulator n=1 Tax=Bailinhaonella thermotolerans TaxID=1070861 RepID=A0A3A4BC80_9ACTN|nr:helix-turn-helix transcriptional regulator [Bailinhaonella thermotolerans]RJL35706.1 XRE family transcriptional regulator [Bailinhaonella thermotolerans]
MGERNELAAFLRSRRGRITPETVGISGGARRRVAGLRREEVAQLAGISVEYYQRLEQGRTGRPSPEVLDALARALRLDEVEREHLRTLAVRDRPGREVRPREVRPELVRMLKLVHAPAMIINDRFDVLAANAVAAHLFTLDPAPAVPVNLARRLFLAAESRTFYVEWDEVAAETAGQLRVAAGLHPGDADLAGLIRELRAGSETFRTLWNAREVSVRTHGVKNLRHPALGTVTFGYENFAPADHSRQRLVVLVPVAASTTEAAVHLLTSWTRPAPPTPSAHQARAVPTATPPQPG